ncbi:hypothetical protein [Pendulispora albinea]|uniref:Uncharacterized protein n=1 Tax=Pendulispora albinea TaxID=2741071 RepID=A0ABZ2LYM9_9BACT
MNLAAPISRAGESATSFGLTGDELYEVVDLAELLDGDSKHGPDRRGDRG